jgi:hypothetical protein
MQNPEASATLIAGNVGGDEAGLTAPVCVFLRLFVARNMVKTHIRLLPS